VSLTNKTFGVSSAPTAVAAKAKRGTSFMFTLKAPAKVTIAITKLAPGVKRGKRCVAAGAKPHAKHCTRAVKAGTLTRSHLHNGPNVIAFSGRIGKRALKPGKYAATINAANAKGKSKPVALRFTIVK
jgi:hypothetical protein